MDHGLTGAGENIKKILEHLQRSAAGVTTPPRKKQSRGAPLSPLQENQRSAISEIARAARPALQHMSPRSQSHIYSLAGEETEGEDAYEETEGNDIDVVNLADDAQCTLPRTKIRSDKSNTGKGKAVVVLDSQSGGEDEETQRMEEYENRRSQRPQGQEERRRKVTGRAEAGRRRLQNAELAESNAKKGQTNIYNMSDEEGTDSDTKTEVSPRRTPKKATGLDGRDGARTAGGVGRPSLIGARNILQPLRAGAVNASDQVPRGTQTYRRQNKPERPQSPKSSRAVAVATTEVPQTMRPRKNGVSWNTYSPILFRNCFFGNAIKHGMCNKV